MPHTTPPHSPPAITPASGSNTSSLPPLKTAQRSRPDIALDAILGHYLPIWEPQPALQKNTLINQGGLLKNHAASLGCANGDNVINGRKVKRSHADDIKIVSGHAVIIPID